MQKYDFIKKQYTPYTPPQNGHCDIMVHANEELNCAACGRTINEHNAYTSAAIQNDIGIGYLICKSCYEHELEIRKDDGSKVSEMFKGDDSEKTKPKGWTSATPQNRRS